MLQRTRRLASTRRFTPLHFQLCCRFVPLRTLRSFAFLCLLPPCTCAPCILPQFGALPPLPTPLYVPCSLRLTWFCTCLRILPAAFCLRAFTGWFLPYAHTPFRPAATHMRILRLCLTYLRFARAFSRTTPRTHAAFGYASGSFTHAQHFLRFPFFLYAAPPYSPAFLPACDTITATCHNTYLYTIAFTTYIHPFSHSSTVSALPTLHTTIHCLLPHTFVDTRLPVAIYAYVYIPFLCHRSFIPFWFGSLVLDACRITLLRCYCRPYLPLLTPLPLPFYTTFAPL